MLPKQYRLKNQKAFDATYKQRQVVADKFLTLYIGKKKPDDSEQITKIGFVVSKKFHKRAVKRNRIKRLIREAFRLEIKEKSLKNAEKYLSLIVIPKFGAVEADFGCIQRSVRGLIEKIR